MTPISSSINPSPFNTTPSPATSRLDKPFSFPQHDPDLDSVSLNTVIHERSRQPSPASVLSVASAHPPRNQENFSPLSRARHERPGGRSVSTNSPKTEDVRNNRDAHKARNFTYQRLSLVADRDDPEFEDEDETTWSEHIELDGDAVIIGTEQSLCRALSKHSHPFTPAPSPKNCENGPATCSSAKAETPNHHVKLVTPESGLVSRIRDIRQLSSSKEGSITHSLMASIRQSVHSQRLSDSSSGFVHSMKTASFTNASFSIAPKSSRMGRSTDSYLARGSQYRYSVDSDRPLSNGSSDDAAVRRGFKRQQIIDELITTEESYISDLKALVYLYSTLLASTSSIPNKVKIAIERNVVCILHIHEELLAQFREARTRAAARRWADTEVPARLGHQRKSYSQRVQRDTYSRETTIHRRVRSSVDSVEVSDSHPRQSGSAEPIDVSEIISILRLAAKDFHAYEEYCANFGLIGPELQKHSPNLWQTYESGMESLARVIMTIDQKQVNCHRGLTVSDLLIKPIQRLTKYPLLLEQLLNNTPVADAPSTHVKLEIVLQDIRNVVQMVNLARENPYTRQQIQRRSHLQDRLVLSGMNITPEQFRNLGSIELCGVLHVAYQTNSAISGCYALCVLFDEHFLVALPVGVTGQFEAMALMQLSDIKIEAPTDGKGLQCASAFFTWKLSFACERYYHELILSGCSKVEEERWIAGLRGEFSHPVHCPVDAENFVTTRTVLNLRSVGIVFSSQKSLSRESSVQRAATVGGRPSISHVIVRNTYNAHDLPEHRDSNPSITSINRSQSHMNTKRVPVLEPRKSERTRLESSISDIWTKERLPFPGMVGSRGGQIIRASAGSLARKLSLASIHTPFSKGRTSSLSTASKKSYDILNEAISTFEVRKPEHDINLGFRSKPKDIPEVDDMRSVVERMISGSTPRLRADINTSEAVNSGTRSKKSRKTSIPNIGPDDPATIFYEASARLTSSSEMVTGSTESGSPVGAEGCKRRKKRWSRHWPIEKLKEFSSEARGMFSSSSSGS